MTATTPTPTADRKASLFDLAGDAFRIEARIAEAAEGLISDDPATIEAATAELEALIAAEANNEAALLAKADAWCWAIERIRAQADARRSHSLRLKELADADERKAQSLQDKLINQLLFLAPDATSFNLPSHKLASRASQVVDLDADMEPGDFPEEYQREKTTVAVDKAAIKAALKAGTEIKGAELISRRSWSIK
jgi:hypothetical protein